MKSSHLILTTVPATCLGLVSRALSNQMLQVVGNDAPCIYLTNQITINYCAASVSDIPGWGKRKTSKEDTNKEHNEEEEDAGEDHKSPGSTSSSESDSDSDADKASAKNKDKKKTKESKESKESGGKKPAGDDDEDDDEEHSWAMALCDFSGTFFYQNVDLVDLSKDRAGQDKQKKQ